MEGFTNKAAAIIDLQQRGYDQDFVLKNEHLLCVQCDALIAPDEFEITEVHHFDGRPRMKDNYVIYGIRSVNLDFKGILMTSYGAFTCGLSLHLWKKLAPTFN